LSVCKWLLAYGDPDKFDLPADIEWTTGITVYLCVIVSDHLYERKADPEEHSEHTIYEVVRNAVFNASENPYLAIARTNYIYKTLGGNRDLYEPKEYVDYISRFQSENGYSIDDYLAVLFGIIAGLMRTPADLIIGWSHDADQWFSQTAMKNLARQIIQDQMLLSIQDARSWAFDTIDAPWDFSLFQSRPLLAVNDQVLFPIYPRFLYDQIFHGLYHKIRHCYPATDTDFMRFFGRPFEEYVKLLVRESTQSSPLPYLVFDEFTYTTLRGEEKSPDVMIRLDDRLLAIEVKAKRLRIAGIVKGKRDTIDEDRQSMLREPLKRAHDKLFDLLKPRSEIDLTGVSKIYLMVVTMGEFPTLQPLEARLLSELQNDFSISIEGIYHLDIEEFEYFCHLLSRRTPIFRALTNKTVNEPFLSFRTFLHAASLPRKRPQSVIKEADQFFEVVTKLLFPG
jgi:hypothetical protein